MSDAELLSPARSPLRRLTGVQIIGTGSYVPENVVTNEDLAAARLRRRLDHPTHRHPRTPPRPA